MAIAFTSKEKAFIDWVIWKYAEENPGVGEQVLARKIKKVRRVVLQRRNHAEIPVMENASFTWQRPRTSIR